MGLNVVEGITAGVKGGRAMWFGHEVEGTSVDAWSGKGGCWCKRCGLSLGSKPVDG